MRTPHHPKIEEINIEGILHAFSDPVRIEIYVNLASAECAKNCSTFLTIQKRVLPKSTLSLHFRILCEAGLIYCEPKGVELTNTTRCDELKDRFGLMIMAIIEDYAKQQTPKP